MDTSSTTGIIPAAVTEDDGVLTVDEDFKCIYDAPYVIVNLIDGDLVALVEGDPDDEAATQARIKTATDVGSSEGYLFHAAVYGELGPNFISIYFAPGPDGEA